MTSPHSNEAPFTKRMRLGTRSCAECRRRRIRCIYPTNGEACVSCVRHETPCRAQQPSQPAKATGHQGDEFTEMRQRLEGLEKLVRELRAGEADTQSSPSAIGGRQGSLTSSSNYAHSGDSDSVRGHTPLLDSEEMLDCSSHAPLVDLVKRAALIETPTRQPNLAHVRLAPGVHDAIQTIRRFKPSHNALRSVLETTEPYWSAWPKYYCTDEVGFQPGEAVRATSQTLEALESSDPFKVTKAALWLALCMQQLPLVCDETFIQLPASTKDLVEWYMQAAKTILDEAGTRQQTIECVESYNFLCKLYVNAGKLRKAWLCSRQGMSAALLSGLHHLDITANDRHRCVWSQAWQHDLITSVILGLPWSLTMSHPAVSRALAPSGPISDLWYVMAALAASIVERDQQGRRDDFATAVRIDQEWEECKAMIPAEWWQETPQAGLGFAALYYRQVCKALVYNMRILIHVPFILKTQTDCRYEHSRVVALDASRGLIQAHCGLRDNKITESVFCEVMDFHAISAGLVLAANLLGTGASFEETGSSDWQLIESLSRTLRRTARLADCRVASQGAHLLETLVRTGRGEVCTPRRYEAILPYFGKICLSRRQSPSAQTCSSLSEAGLATMALPLDLADIDFGIELFDSDSLGLVDIESELSMNWTTLFET